MKNKNQIIQDLQKEKEKLVGNIERLKSNIIYKQQKEIDYINKIDKLKQGVDNVIVIHFISGDGYINQAIKCFKKEKFSEAVDRLYELYVEYKDKENVFLYDGKVMDKYKTIEQNQIKDGEKIQLQNFDSSIILNKK